jgi:hypothetical protein
MQTRTRVRVAFVHRNAITFMDILHFAGAFRLAGFPLGTRNRRGMWGWRVETVHIAVR